MMRINLLPPEILERRKSERRIVWVALAAVVVALVLAGVWGFAAFRVQNKEDELAEVQQLVQSQQALANQLAIFEERASELETRRTIAEQALASRRNWGKLYNELSLVMPSDVWLQGLTVNEEGGISFGAIAIDAPSDTPDAGHKAIARTLVRMTDLDDLYDVWLSGSSKTQVAGQPAIQFSITAKVVTPGADEGAQQ